MPGRGRKRAKEEPEMDPEFQEEAAATNSESDDESESGGSDDVAEMQESGRLRMRADIALDGENYAGKRTTREAVLGNEESDLNNDTADLDDDTAEVNGRLRSAYGEGSSEDEEEASQRLIIGQDDELDALSREYEKLREEEEKGLEILRGQEKGDHLKGLAVQHQRALWDRALEVRITLQKVLSAANRLPGKQSKDSLCQENEQVKEAYAALIDSSVRTLDSLVDLEMLLIEDNSTISDSYSSRPNENGKRDAAVDVELEGETRSGRVWEKLDHVYSQIMPYRDSALDRWQRKTQIYTGAVAKVKLRAFNQSVSQQVATTMRDSSRLIERMRLKKGTVHVLGQPPVANEVEDFSTNPEEDVESEAPNAITDHAGDPETFDDSEFYQQLLREFLESSDPNSLTSMNIYNAARQHNKTRKQVDRRASKGRKIRYNVFEPLLNFMAPKPMVLPPMTTQLFSNIFGQKRIAPSSTV